MRRCRPPAPLPLRVLALVLISATALPLWGQDRNAVLAGEEFRRGVQAYDRYSFNDAILSFERALGYKPAEPLILERLGRAYYRSGLEDTAVRQWQAAAAAYPETSSEGILLRSRIETVRLRRSLYPELDANARYVETGRYPGMNGDVRVYGQPTGVLPQNDGSAWVVAYGSDELVRIDPNGVVRQRTKGPANGFDRPYDIVRGLDGRLYVSEQRGNRVSVLSSDGTWLSYIGSKGRGDGQFVGPQHLAMDDQGYLYVVDWGNRRVLKFDPNGPWLLSFGQKSPSFSGFLAPTGIAVVGGRVFVADAARKSIASFDGSGNFISWVGQGLFQYPESLRADRSGRLLVADTSRIMIFDPHTQAYRELGRLGNAGVRIVAADLDTNGSLLAANFASGEVSVLARADDLATGLFVQIERVIADAFPKVRLEVSVQDRGRRPIVGLEAVNFLVSEKGAPASAFRLEGAAYRNQRVDVALMVERSPQLAGREDDLAQAARDVATAADGVQSFVSAGEQPVKESHRNPAELAAAASKGSVPSSSSWKFDIALRLAGSDLLTGEKKRGVFFLCSGHLDDGAFDRYSLSELASFLANNDISFYPVVLPPLSSDAGEADGTTDKIGTGGADEALRYLAEQSGGRVIDAFAPGGIKPVMEDLREKPNGHYLLSYESTLPTDFGRAYLPVEVEAYLLSRSGRDATGYFAPLQ